MRYYLGFSLSTALIFSVYANSHHPQEFLESVKGSRDEGLQIYRHFCANCHAKEPQIPLGAPPIGVEELWKPRLTQGAQVLIQHTQEGINAMPPRGGCFECSDEQLLLAIRAMLPEARNDYFNTKRPERVKSNKKD